MSRKRIALTVLVDLDPAPGAFHTKEHAKEVVEAMLLSTVGHYDPVVIINEEHLEQEPT